MIAHAPVNVQELTDLDYMLLLYLRDNRGFHSPYTLSHELGEEGKTVARALERLAAMGLVRKSLAALVYGITEQGMAAII